ncbi:MAG: hypothetical protein RIR52_2443 [Acidobacteriota bacterium]|jgi:predicted amidophosphoribosyltransferase
MMKCKHCNYPIFQYSQCCPNCGRKVVSPVSNSNAVPPPRTRFDFWVAGLKKSVVSSKPRRPISA